MRLRLLGPLELVDGDGSPVVITAPKRRAVLAALALDANRMVLADELLGFVWGDDPPQSARTALQVHISGIRKQLGSDMRLVTHERGYRLLVPPDAVDTLRFAELVEQARRAERGEAAVDLLRAALDLWRGSSALADVPGGVLRDLAAGRLAEARLAALESLAGHLIALGRGGEIVAELSEALRSDRLRESMVDKLIAGLAQVGRQADAIEIYHETKRGLRDELGVDPGRRLQETYHALLAGGLGTAADVPAPAPPNDHTGSAPAPAAQLPRNVSSFVARDAELRWLLDRIAPGAPGAPRESGVVLVVGQAGVGKTALAVRAARQAGPDFPDGQLFVNLRGFDAADPVEPDAALVGFLRALGVADSRVPESLAERCALYRSLTADRQMLVVLDNARSAAQVRPLLPGGSRNLVLVTSRNRMDGLLVREGATLLTLHPLSEPDSVRLLTTVVGDQRVSLTGESALRLARLCAGLPLALRIAASRVTMAGTDEAVATLVEELSDERARLAALSTEDSDVSLRATLSSTYRSLPDDAASLFRLIGLHPGDTIDVHTVAALAGWAGARSRPALSALTAAHLLQEVAADRYQMHDLLRLYGRELAAQELGPGERAAALLRLLDYYLHVSGTVRTAITSGVTPAHYAAVPPGELPRSASEDGLSWFISEEPAMYGLLAAGLRGGHHRHVWQLADNLSPLYCRAGSTVRWADAMRIGLDAAEADRDGFGRSLLLWRWGGALRAMGRPDQALPVLRQAHALTTSAGDDPVRRFNVLRELGYCETQLNLFEDVHKHYGEARELARRLGLPVKEAFILDILAWTCARAGDAERSRHYAELALDTLRTARSGGDDAVQNSARGLMLYNEADILQRLGRNAEAMAKLTAAHELVSLANDRRGEAGCLAAIGTVLTRMGRDDEARRPLTEALALYTELACSDADEVRAALDELTSRQESRIAGRGATG